MTVGKPDFDLNSFGVKYLSKDEIQEFIDKRTQGESIGTKTELGDAKQMTSRGTTSGRTNISSVSSTSGIESRPHPKLFGQHRETVGEGGGTGSVGRKFTEKKPEPIKPTESTVSVFNSPSYGTTERMKKPKTTDPSEGKIPSPEQVGSKRPYEHVGAKGEKYLKETSPKKERTGNTDSGSKEGILKPSKLGDAPKDVKGKETKIGQKKIRVGVGEKAHEKLEEVGGVGDKRYAADKKSPYSEASERKRERESTQSKKLGAAQSKVHELKRRRDIEALGTAKKSDDIIMDMNILKLDLMKGKKDPLGERLGSVIGKPKNITNDGVADYEKGDDNDFFSLDDKALKSQAEETIFKAISLKLDLMNKKEEWDKNERNNEKRSRRGRGSPDKSKLPFGVKQEMLHSQGVSRSGTGRKGRKINPKTQTFGEDVEEYGEIYDRQNEALKSQAEETIFKAISLKLDLSKMDYNTEGQYPHVNKDPKKKLPTAPKNDIRRLSDRFDESHNYSEDEKT